MGVHGLWKLIEPTGQMVPLESLAGKILAVDVSIWLHQAVKGMHDSSGAPVAVAHLLILFHRLCKLLFYKIKPVFVFDGGVPALKRQTMAARRQQSSSAKNEAMKVREKLIKNLLKHEAVRQVLSNETASAALGLNSFALPGPSVEEDLYKLPPIAADYVDSESSESPQPSDEEDEKHLEDIHSIDVTSKEFLNLPPEVRHDILTELIDTRKQSSWKYLDCMPKQSDSFSDFQMNRLLKRRAVQTSLEAAGKEMGGKALSLKELESLLGDQGVLDPDVDLPGRRIAQDSVTRFMLIQNEPSGDVPQPKEDGVTQFKQIDVAQTKQDDLPQAKEEEKSNEKFNIMNHLDEVDWSSESDTDVILKEHSEIKKEETVSVKPKEEASSQVEVKREVIRKPKVRITEEIANILSVLEDDDVDSDVKKKVEVLQNKLGLKNEPQNKEELEGISLTDSKKSAEEKPDNQRVEGLPNPIIKIEKEDDSLDFTEISVQNTQENIVIDLKTEEEENLKESSDLIIENQDSTKESMEESSVVDMTSEKEGENPLPSSELKEQSEEQPSPGISATPAENVQPENKTEESNIENATETSDSLSDSENDFITVTDSKTESVASDKKEEEKSSEKTENITTGKSNGDEPLVVTINPENVQEKDDIFADLFQPSSNQNKDDRNEDREEVKIDEVEKINEYKEDFRKELSGGDIGDLKKTLEDQQRNLLKEHGKQERHAANPTDQMYSDAQELLRLFGVPFIVAPMEAEAQCAILNLLGLTEGTITDDSDIWLFGGRVVYKNFFNQNKHVLEYRSENIQKYFKLTRQDMIRMALLVGSDYTVGLNGIGPVTAMEILAAFHSPNENLLDCLQKFRDWFTGRTKGGPPRTSLKKKIRNTIISPGFPNRAVAEAYLHPQVDDSKEPFSWAKPNLDLIQQYARERMGWSTDKCNELLLPVLKKMEENANQHTMEKYFRIMEKTSMTEGVLSKRVESAIKKLGGSPVDEDDPEPKPKRKRKGKKENSPRSSDEVEGNPKRVKKIKIVKEKNVDEVPKTSGLSEKTKLINERLHQDVKVPQREMSLKLQQEKKQKAIEIFRTFKTGGKKKKKVFAKEEVKLSESSSDED